MKQLKHFLAFALIAAMMLGAVDANAKTKRTKTNRSKTTRTTKKPQNNNGIFTLEFFQNVINEANSYTPIDEGDGVILTSITMKGTNIYYDAEITDDELIETIKEMPTLFEAYMKSYMTNYMCETYSSYAGGSMIFDEMVKLGITMNFRFHEQGKSASLMAIKITPQDMKAVAQNY